jgi:hypothetical protein
MFQFPGLAPLRVIYLQYIRLSHSEIFGLSLVCSYPKLIAAYHVLHRLSMPRHPPYALIRFKYCFVWLFLHLCKNPCSFIFTTVSLVFLLKKIAFPICQRTLFILYEHRKCDGLEPTALPTQLHSLLSISLLPKTSIQKEWRISESNRWPPACKAGALASWANPPSVMIPN